VRRLLVATGQRHNSARWALALALGLRQGEALGLKWDDVDLHAGRLIIRRNRIITAKLTELLIAILLVTMKAE